jgi:hypothetical protein
MQYVIIVIVWILWTPGFIFGATYIYLDSECIQTEAQAGMVG